MATDQDKPLFVWLQMLRDRNVNRRRQAAGALGCIGLPAVVGVVKIFKEGNHVDRYWALQALGQIGPAAKVALPVVLLALKDRHANVREAAREALGRIDPDPAAKERGLWHCLRRWWFNGQLRDVADYSSERATHRAILRGPRPGTGTAAQGGPLSAKRGWQAESGCNRPRRRRIGV